MRPTIMWKWGVYIYSTLEYPIISYYPINIAVFFYNYIVGPANTSAKESKINTNTFFFIWKKYIFTWDPQITMICLGKDEMWLLRLYLVCQFKHMFSIFKQHYNYFYRFFHSHVFLYIFSNNKTHVLSTCTKHPLSCFILWT